MSGPGHGEPPDREWLVTNGLGGYASATVGGAGTRRYHGYLIAALPGGRGRVVTLARVGERVRLDDGAWLRLAGEERARSVRFEGTEHLAEFRLELGLPAWRFEVGGAVIEKRVFMGNEQNSVYLDYRLLSSPRAVRLVLEPYVRFRRHEEPVDAPLPLPFTVTAAEDSYEIAPADPEIPPLRLRLRGPDVALVLRSRVVSELLYRAEAHRGYAQRGSLWTPGRFTVRLAPGRSVCLVASVESWERIPADPKVVLEAERERRRGLLSLLERPGGEAGAIGQLALAADQFLVTPAWRREERAGRGEEGEPRSVVAGYHWFTDWGRDTMISLEGLTLVTARFEEARWILRSFARHLRDGLIPNLFPEGDRRGLYHTADATLWMFHAVDRYVVRTGDRETLRALLPDLREVVRRHLEGTSFGIGVDPADGLLRQGAPGYALTWMDAKVDDWVVTPRRGKAVEINALWYNALTLLEGWMRDEGDAAAERLAEHAARARRSFNDRFWYDRGGYLYDVVDGEEGDDPACRPNQLLAVSLPHPVLEARRREPVLRTVRDRLLTRYGLRTLDPAHPCYRPEYFGDLRARDAAYHQGTVWPWLLGPLMDAWLRVWPEDVSGARGLVEGLVAHLDHACVGTVSEIFDAEPPHTPRGCVAQAWSVAELLRCLARTEPRSADPEAAPGAEAATGPEAAPDPR